MWSKDELVAAFRDIGLRAGDLVLVHSALRRLGPVAGGGETVIDALLSAVGPAGTVAVPTHSWKVVGSEHPVFHQLFTPSNVGALTNLFRLRPGAVRGLHPTHSVAAIGPRAAELVAGHEFSDTPCAADSPYGKLRDWGGKVLIIGPGLECCTFFHGCEQWAGVPWAVSEQTVRLTSMAMDGRVFPIDMHYHIVSSWEQYPRLEPGLLAAGALTLGTLGACPLRLLDARRAAEWLVPRLREDARILLPAGELSEP